MSLFKKNDPIPKEDLLFSRKAIISLIVPLIIQQVLNVLVGTIDSVMVSYAGEAAVSGVSLINTLDTLLIVFFTALVGGGAVVVSQALGKKDQKDANESAKQLLYIATAVATVLTVTVLILRKPLLTLLFGDVEPDVMANAISYFFFVALSFPLLAITESISACFRSTGNTLLSLLVSLLINLVNVCGNATLIYGFKMGAAGAAIATLFARFVGAAVLLVLIHRQKYEVHIKRLFHYRPNRPIIRKILHIGIPNGISDSMFQFGRLLTQTLISTMGTAVIAANAVSLTICNYQYITGNACGAAMIAVVGRCVGARNERQAKYYSRMLLILNYVALWVIVIFTLLFMHPLISAYNLSEASSSLAQELIVFHSICSSLIWPIGFMLPSAFRAAGDVRMPMVVSIVSMWVFRVASAYPLALESISLFGLTVPCVGLGIMGVWIAMVIDWIFRTTLFFRHYLSGKWLKIQHL